MRGAKASVEATIAAVIPCWRPLCALSCRLGRVVRGEELKAEAPTSAKRRTADFIMVES